MRNGSSPGAQPLYFATSKEMRQWLSRNHAKTSELLVGFIKVNALRDGVRSITWPESVEEALCFGWIDGIRRGVDERRYTIRFTPRRPGSKWSAVNVRLIAKLEADGRMTDAGRRVFAARKDADSSGYAAQKKVGELDPARRSLFKKHAAAWKFFEAQPAGYQKKLAWWVMQAKQDETRDRRLRKLIETSAQGRRIE